MRSSLGNATTRDRYVILSTSDLLKVSAKEAASYNVQCTELKVDSKWL